jgi:hypothetical protein
MKDNRFATIATTQEDISEETIHPPLLLYGFIYKIKTEYVSKIMMFITKPPDLESLLVKNDAEPARQATLIWRISRNQ